MGKPLPSAYQWLNYETGPKMIVEARRHYGTLEIVGNDNNPDITKWATEIGGNVADVYRADEIPWCGLFMAICAKRAEKDLPRDPLWALNWATFGTYSPIPCLGDVLVFVRKGGGHVGIYVGEDPEAFHVLGGNQSNAVSIARMTKGKTPKLSFYTCRRPVYKIGQPWNVRPIQLTARGKLSTEVQ